MIEWAYHIYNDDSRAGRAFHEPFFLYLTVYAFVTNRNCKRKRILNEEGNDCSFHIHRAHYDYYELGPQ